MGVRDWISYLNNIWFTEIRFYYFGILLFHKIDALMIRQKVLSLSVHLCNNEKLYLQQHMQEEEKVNVRKSVAALTYPCEYFLFYLSIYIFFNTLRANPTH